MITEEEYKKLISIIDSIKYLGILSNITNDLYYSNDFIVNIKIYNELISKIDKLYKELTTNYKNIILKYINKDRFEKLKEKYKNIYTIDFLIEFVKEL